MISPHRLDQLTNDEQDLLQDDAAAFVLDALDAEEAREYRAHLSQCDLCTEYVRELGGTAALLALAVDDPPDLADLPPLTETPEMRHTIIEAASFRRRNRFLQPVGMLAIAASIATLALGGWNVALQVEARNQQAQMEESKQVLAKIAGGGRITSLVAGEYSGVLVVPDDGSMPMLLPGPMPAAPNGHMYQIWGLDGGAPRNLGVFAPGRSVVQLNAPLTGLRQVALTVEPGPKGSAGPTTQPFLVGGV